MTRTAKPSSGPVLPGARPQATVDLTISDDAAIASVSGLVDERFTGFGGLGPVTALILDVTGMTRMTSFGVRQWLKAMDAIPKTIGQIFLLGCPTFFVDQLNMVLNFGGTAKVLTVVAPYSCPSCGMESGETIDILAERHNLAKGGVPDKECSRCGNKLEFDETPESYFAFTSKYGAANLPSAIAQLLALHDLYLSVDAASEKPAKILKLVHGSVTYYRISGVIGAMFRARPFLVGAEGQVVIDLAEVERFERDGLKEWRRLIKTLATQVDAITLVDVNKSFLATAGDALASARNIAVASVLVPYACIECGRKSNESQSIDRASAWPPQFQTRICSTCGGTTSSSLSLDVLGPLQKASAAVPPASAKVIAQRDEILSRALTDANVAQAGAAATAEIGADDTILGKYKIVRRLSEGGMAEVFLAKQVGIGGFEKPVALKRIQHKLLESRHTAIDMFLNEAKIAGRLMHPNIVQVHDVGEVHGALYLAMEYVHGKDLRDALKLLKQRHSTIRLAEACHIVREVAQALHHAYWSTDIDGNRLAVVHRDVSPQNIILSYDGAVKLLDFGVAMSAVTEHAETMIVGKWLYMSPEATSNEPIDHRSDLFSLGVILYLLCTGQMPFSGRDPKQIVKRVRSGQYQPPEELAPLPEALALLIKQMLAPNPDHRPQRGQEVAVALTEIMQQHGLVSSSTNIAHLVSELFPDPASTPAPPESEPIHINLVGPPPRISESYTPQFPIDVSVSLKPRAISAPIRRVTQPNLPVPEAITLPRQASRGRTFVLLVLLLLLGGGAYLLFWSDLTTQF